MSKPLESPIAELRATRARLARELAECDRQLAVLLRAQQELISAIVEEHALDFVPSSVHSQPTMLGRTEESGDSRELKIAKSRTKGRKRAPEVQALYDAKLTPNSAAKLCGTTRDVLKQAWAKGDQFREIRDDWKATLAKAGVPKGVWRSSSRG